MRMVIVLMLVGFCMTPLLAQEQQVLQDEAAQAAWREDVDFLVEKLQTIHPEPYFRFSADSFQQAADELKAEIPYLSDTAIMAALARITAMLDGHTYLFLFQERVNFHLYPIRLYDFDEGFYVVNAAPAFRELIGQRLISINGVAAAEVYTALTPYSSTDSPAYLRLWTPTLMASPEVLQAAGIIEEDSQMVFEAADGTQQTVNFTPMTLHEYLSWNPNGHLEMIGLPGQPDLLYLSNKGKDFWYTYLAESQTIYMQYNHVYSRTQSGATIGALAEEFTELAAHENAQRLVIDLRHNGGGNNTSYGLFIRRLAASEFNAPGKLYVIIGRMTFSAGKDFVLDLARATGAIIIGEPSGGSPNNYGNNVRTTLPNSRLEVYIATNYVEKARLQDTESWIAPGILVVPTAADYFSGRDAVLDYIVSQ